jgi:hypothetical protein
MDEVAKVMQIEAVEPPRDDLFQCGQRGIVSRITLQSACTCVRCGRSVRSIVASGAACTERLSSVPASREIGVRSRMPRSSRFRRRIGHASRTRCQSYRRRDPTAKAGRSRCAGLGLGCAGRGGRIRTPESDVLGVRWSILGETSTRQRGRQRRSSGLRRRAAVPGLTTTGCTGLSATSPQSNTSSSTPQTPSQRPRQSQPAARRRSASILPSTA